MSTLLQSKLAGVRAKHSMVATGTGATHALVLAIAWIAGTMILDRLCELPWALRAVMLLIGIGAVLTLFFMRSILPIIKSPDDEELALKVEHEEPEFQTRLIATIQFSQLSAVPAGASPSLVRVMMNEAESIAGPKNFNRVIKTDLLLKSLGVALGTVVLAIILFIWGGERASNLLARAFLSNVDLLTRTKVINDTETTQIPQGDDFVIKCRADGYSPDAGKLEVEYKSGQYLTYEIPRVKDTEINFSTTLSAVQEDFEYRIRLFDGHTAWISVKVKERPVVKTISVRIIKPAYTGMGPEVFENGNYAALPGSKIQVTIESNKSLASSSDMTHSTHVHRFAAEKDSLDFPMTISGDKRQFATCEFDYPATKVADPKFPEGRFPDISFSVLLFDDDGFANKDPAAYPISLIRDDPPTVVITKPGQDSLFTSVATVDLRYKAVDAYKVGSVVLKYFVDAEKDKEVSIPLKIEQAKVVDGAFPWAISSIAPPAGKALLEGSTITCWLEATDTNNITGPGKTASNKCIIHVVSLADKALEMKTKTNEPVQDLATIKLSQEGASQELQSTLTGEPATKPANP